MSCMQLSTSGLAFSHCHLNGEERDISIMKVKYLEPRGDVCAHCIVHRIDPCRRRSM